MTNIKSYGYSIIRLLVTSLNIVPERICDLYLTEPAADFHDFIQNLNMASFDYLEVRNGAIFMFYGVRFILQNP